MPPRGLCRDARPCLLETRSRAVRAHSGRSAGQERRVTTLRRAPQFRLRDRALEAKRQAERQRYDLPDRPREPLPKIPDDITELADEELVVMMTLLTRWAEHLGVQLAMAEVDERWAEAGMEKERAVALLDGSAKDVTQRKAKAYQSEEFLEAEEKYHEAMAYRKLVAVLFNNAERWSALLSRDLTRRVNREPRERRVNRSGA